MARIIDRAARRRHNSLTNLNPAPPTFGVQQYGWCFTPTQSEAEDQLRGPQLLLRPSTLSSGLIDADSARHLAARLVDEKTPDTPASSRYMNEFSCRLTGNLLRLIAERPDEPLTLASAKALIESSAS